MEHMLLVSSSIICNVTAPRNGNNKNNCNNNYNYNDYYYNVNSFEKMQLMIGVLLGHSVHVSLLCWPGPLSAIAADQVLYYWRSTAGKWNRVGCQLFLHSKGIVSLSSLTNNSTSHGSHHLFAPITIINHSFQHAKERVHPPWMCPGRHHW